MDTSPLHRLEPGRTRVSFTVRWFGVLRVRGWFADVTGTVGVPGLDGQDASVSAQVAGASVRTGIALRDRHLRGPRFLDSGRHPSISFHAADASRQNGGWSVRGTLSLRGRDRAVSVSVRDEPASGGDRRLAAEFTVPRREHGIGTAHGLRRLNPLLWAIAADVTIHVEMLVPATLLQPAAAYVPAR